MSVTSEKVKICPRCKTEFTCKVDTNCDCTKITISESNLIYIKQHWNDCLCGRCLKEFQK